MTLIAKVRVLVLVDGERQEFAPGDALPKLHPHDRDQLLACGSIEDTTATAADEKLQRKEEASALFAFEAERLAVITASDSTTANDKPPAAKKAAKSAS